MNEPNFQPPRVLALSQAPSQASSSNSCRRGGTKSRSASSAESRARSPDSGLDRGGPRSRLDSRCSACSTARRRFLGRATVSGTMRPSHRSSIPARKRP